MIRLFRTSVSVMEEYFTNEIVQWHRTRYIRHDVTIMRHNYIAIPNLFTVHSSVHTINLVHGLLIESSVTISASALQCAYHKPCAWVAHRQQSDNLCWFSYHSLSGNRVNYQYLDTSDKRTTVNNQRLSHKDTQLCHRKKMEFMQCTRQLKNGVQVSIPACTMGNYCDNLKHSIIS